MSEQRWTAPETGWYQYDSAKGFPLEFLGTEKPESADAQFYGEGDTLMNSGGSAALAEASRRGPALVVDWVTEPVAPQR